MNLIDKSSRGFVKFPFKGVSFQISRQTTQLSNNNINVWQQLFGKVPKQKNESEVKSYDEMVGPKGLPFLGSALDYTFLGPYSPKEYTIALKDRHQKLVIMFNKR